MQNILSIKNKTMKLKKGSAEAKRFMSKIRAMRSGTKKKPTKKIGNIYDTIKNKVKRTATATKKNVALNLIDKLYDSVPQKQKVHLKATQELINNTYLGATKFFEANLETKSSKPKRSIAVTRNIDGTFKQFNDKVLEARRLRAKLKAKKNKSKISGLHKDTKSHNVKISVMSGDKNVLLNLAKERDSLIYIIGNLEREIIYFRGDIKWYGKSKANIHIYKNRKSDIEFNKKASL